ncbi:hypothetical protein HQ535_08955 [bacterium]|nr:hypothetical protein [bacterium]
MTLFIRSGSRFIPANDDEVTRAVLRCATLRGKVWRALVALVGRMGL